MVRDVLGRAGASHLSDLLCPNVITEGDTQVEE